MLFTEPSAGPGGKQGRGDAGFWGVLERQFRGCVTAPGANRRGGPVPTQRSLRAKALPLGFGVYTGLAFSRNVSAL